MAVIGKVLLLDTIVTYEEHRSSQCHCRWHRSTTVVPSLKSFTLIQEDPQYDHIPTKLMYDDRN